MFLVKHCPGCGKRSSVEVPEAGYLAWQQGTLYAREAFPDLTSTQIDTVLTGWHEECVAAIDTEEEENTSVHLAEARLARAYDFDLESLIEG